MSRLISFAIVFYYFYATTNTGAIAIQSVQTNNHAIIPTTTTSLSSSPLPHTAGASSGSGRLKIIRPLQPFRRYRYHHVVNTFQRSFKGSNGPSMKSSSSSSIPNDADSNSINVSNNNNDKIWAAYAILLSSFTDGIERSPAAQEFFKYGLVSILVRHLVHRTELQLRESVLASPCQGPDVDILNLLEEVDDVLEGCGADNANSNSNSNANGATNSRADKADRMLRWLLHRHNWHHDDDNDNDKNNNNTMEKKGNVAPPLELRIVYIPTAMYALRSDSKNTPGKQRQRARADGKKRRNGLVSTVEKLLGDGGELLLVGVERGWRSY